MQTTIRSLVLVGALLAALGAGAQAANGGAMSSVDPDQGCDSKPGRAGTEAGGGVDGGDPPSLAGPPAGDAPPLPTAFSETCQGIYPGMALQESRLCAGGFVFRDQFGHLYISTPGQCADQGQRVEYFPNGWAGGGVEEFGTVVFSSEGIGNSFALIRIDDDKRDRVRFSLCHWGGPTGLFEEPPYDPSLTTTITDQLANRFPAKYYGFTTSWVSKSVPLSAASAREGWLTTWTADRFTLDGIPYGFFISFDTTPVIDRQGRAVGLITHNLVNVNSQVDGLLAGTRVSHALALVKGQLPELDLALVTAPLRA